METNVPSPDDGAWRAAIHEAGHAMAAHHYGRAIHHLKIDFGVNAGCGGFQMHVGSSENAGFQDAVIAHAGPEAESVIFGSLEEDPSPTWPDRSVALDSLIAANLLHRNPDAMTCAEQLVRQHKGGVSKLATLLREKGCLAGMELQSALAAAFNKVGEEVQGRALTDEHSN